MFSTVLLAHLCVFINAIFLDGAHLLEKKIQDRCKLMDDFVFNV